MHDAVNGRNDAASLNSFGGTTVNRNLNRQALVAASSLALFGGGALAAGRVDPHKQDIGKLKQQFTSVTARNGVAAKAHTRHEQPLQLDAESRLVLKKRHSD